MIWKNFWTVCDIWGRFRKKCCNRNSSRKGNGQKITIAILKTIHVVTDGGKYGDARSVKVKKKKVTIKKGKTFRIKAKAKGTCIIYVYAQNGVYRKVKVTVK